jgi:uncharacterized membrane protein (UPF0182 family)
VFLIGTAIVLVVLLLSARFLSGFYIDYLWHKSVGRGDVFWGVLRSQVFLFVVFGAAFIAVAVLNLVIADRLAPVTFSANMHPVVERFHEVFGRRLRLFRLAVAVFFGLLFALPATGQWQQWTLFRNSQSFGITDPQFHKDIGFYLFQLPFIAFVIDWFFAALVFITLLVLLTHVLNGGVVLQPPRPKVRRATKAHIAVLLALLAVVKAGDYWVKRYELTTERRGFVQGATYAVVKAQLPAVVLLVLISLLVAVMFLSTLKTDSWRVPLVASGLWAVVALLGGVIYPATIQALVVNPNQKAREATYIERNIEATRQALGIGADRVSEQTVEFGALTTQSVSDDLTPLQNVRLLNPTTLVDRFRTDEGQRSGLTIRDLDVDRYEIDGTTEQVMIAARELDLSKIANRSWQGRHLISTHGCGLVLAPANQVEATGRPSYRQLDLVRPELYFSEDLSGYSVVKSTVPEDPCPGQTDVSAYSGNGGVALNSVFRRMAFALDFLDYNLLGSGALDNDSRILWVRSVRDRVEKVAPFLSFDGDPYPVEVDGGVVWVVDAYTTSDRYPYAQNADTSQLAANSGLDFGFNYIRNSVKAVVNAYDGSMQFYRIDDTNPDPVVAAWAKAFPDLFTPLSAMPAELRDHLRYPEDLFRIQTSAYSIYRLDADQFFDRNGVAWSVAQGPASTPRTSAANNSVTTDTVADTASVFAGDAGSAKFVPYYSMLRAPGADTSTFQMLRPFVPFSTDDSRKELQAFMTASSDPGSYGQLTAYVVENSDIDGPATVAATIESETTISTELTLLDQNGSQVIYGDMQLVPIAGGILYVRPLYLRSDASAQASFRYVLVSYNGDAAFGPSLRDALAKLFPGFRQNVGDVAGIDSDNSGTDPGTEPGTDPGTEPTTSTPEELLAQADELFQQADEALPDFAEYDRLNKQARELVQQALELLSGSASD